MEISVDEQTARACKNGRRRFLFVPYRQFRDVHLYAGDPIRVSGPAGRGRTRLMMIVAQTTVLERKVSRRTIGRDQKTLAILTEPYQG